MTTFQKKTLASKKAPEKKIESRKSASSSSTQISSVTNLMAPALSLSKACSIATKTVRPAPDGTPDTRNVVGVGEQVEMTLPKSAEWSASAGAISPAKGSKITWTAPATDMDVEITATWSQKQQCSRMMTVQAPNAISITKAFEINVPRMQGLSGLAAEKAPSAGMKCRIGLLPLSVCLGRTQLLEEGGPATKVTGYFSKLSPGTIHHFPNLKYAQLADDNSLLDTAAGIVPSARGLLSVPYESGSFQWEIPNRYKLTQESAANGRVFAKTIQSFTISEVGTMTVSKGDAFVSHKWFQGIHADPIPKIKRSH